MTPWPWVPRQHNGLLLRGNNFCVLAGGKAKNELPVCESMGAIIDARPKRIGTITVSQLKKQCCTPLSGLHETELIDPIRIGTGRWNRALISRAIIEAEFRGRVSIGIVRGPTQQGVEIQHLVIASGEFRLFIPGLKPGRFHRARTLVVQ